MARFESQASQRVRDCSIEGKVVLIATEEICPVDVEVARAFAAKKCRIIFACNDQEGASLAMEEIRSEGHGDAAVEIDSIALDFGHYQSIVDVTWSLKRGEERIDYIIVHANTMPPQELTRTSDGLEWAIGVNYMGPAALWLHLLDYVRAKGTEDQPIRLLWLTSSEFRKAGLLSMRELNWEKRSYKPLQAYREAALAQVLFGQELANRLSNANVTVLMLHVDSVQSAASSSGSDMQAYLGHGDQESDNPTGSRLRTTRGGQTAARGRRKAISAGRGCKTPEQAAKCVVWMCVEPSLQGPELQIYEGFTKVRLPNLVSEQSNVDDVWKATQLYMRQMRGGLSVAPGTRGARGIARALQPAFARGGRGGRGGM